MNLKTGQEITAPTGEKMGGTKMLEMTWDNLQAPLEDQFYTARVKIGAKSKDEGIIDDVIVSGVMTDQPLTAYEITKAIILLPSSCSEQDSCRILPENEPQTITLDSEIKVSCEQYTKESQRAECNYLANKFVNIGIRATYPVFSQGTNNFFVLETEGDLPKKKKCDIEKSEVDVDKPCIGSGPVDVTVWFSKKSFTAGLDKNNKIRMYISLLNKGGGYAKIKSLEIKRVKDVSEIALAKCTAPWGDEFNEDETVTDFGGMSLTKEIIFVCDLLVPLDFTPRGFAELQMAAQVDYNYIEKIESRKLIGASPVD
jgi:hypothetical protein